MIEPYIAYLAVVVAGAFLLRKIYIRLRLSRAKHPSLRGHAKMSRRAAKLLNFFEYDEARFFCSDGAPEAVANRRRKGLEKLAGQIETAMPQTICFANSLEDSISDVKLTGAYRVPFPYRNLLPAALKTGTIATETRGQQIKDVDGNWRYDVSGSYGVNVFGYDFYKDCMDKGFAKVRDLGPVLGPYHPLIRDNVEQLRAISGLDEVSFHMSGTEAVMQAVRLARYNTGRKYLVRLCGSYHGWWDGVQPGVGNQRQGNDIYTLSDLSDATLRVLETRNDIACVLINPIQALHPNSDSASDASLVASDRSTHFDRTRYTRWLQQIRDICSRRGIVLIFDEVFTGFRLGYRGAQEYWGIQADMVTYGKTLGGGLPVGVVCGRHHLMKRFRDQRPADLSIARGTFNSHPYVIGAMHEFLQRIQSPQIQSIYATVEQTWSDRITRLNQRLEQQQLPVRVDHLQTVVTVLYRVPCRYNWMLQFYLRAEGLELAWVGSGRMIFTFAYTDAEFDQVIERFVAGVQAMQADGWWWSHPQLTNKKIKRQILKDTLAARFPLLAPLLPPLRLDEQGGKAAGDTVERATQS